MGYTLIIDNYDSFTWNVYADIAVLGGNPLVKRNDKITIEEIQVRAFSTGRPRPSQAVRPSPLVASRLSLSSLNGDGSEGRGEDKKGDKELADNRQCTTTEILIESLLVQDPDTLVQIVESVER